MSPASLNHTLESCLLRCFLLPVELRVLIVRFFVIAITNENIRIYIRMANDKIRDLTCGAIQYWDTSKVTDMDRVFYASFDFNMDISRWDVSNVTNMSRMFNSAHSFNQPLNDWNVSNVINMEQMFIYARSFNQPLYKWNVSKVKKMNYMFYSTLPFCHNLNSWQVGPNVEKTHIFTYTQLFRRNKIPRWAHLSV